MLPKVTQSAVVSVCVCVVSRMGFCFEEVERRSQLCIARVFFKGALIGRLLGSMSLRDVTQGGGIPSLSYFRIELLFADGSRVGGSRYWLVCFVSALSLPLSRRRLPFCAWEAFKGDVRCCV